MTGTEYTEEEFNFKGIHCVLNVSQAGAREKASFRAAKTCCNTFALGHYLYVVFTLFSHGVSFKNHSSLCYLLKQNTDW